MEHTYLKNVVTLQLDQEECLGCGLCLDVCPHNVFKLATNKAVIQDRDSCMECGACAKNCPVQAVTVKSGVGCAYGILLGRLRGTEPTCSCAENEEEGSSSCCG